MSQTYPTDFILGVNKPLKDEKVNSVKIPLLKGLNQR